MNASHLARAFLGIAVLLASACGSPFTPDDITPATTSAAALASVASSAPCPNEPTGWQVASARTFAPLTPPRKVNGGLQLDAGWVSTGAFSIISDATSPDGDGWVGQERYTTANRVGNGTMSSDLSPTLRNKRYTSLYTCFMLKVDPNYIGEASGSNKQFWFQVGQVINNRVIALLHIPGPNIGPNSKVWFAVRYQDLDNKPSTTAIFNYSMPISRGVWHRFEMRAQLESSKGAADGWIKSYTDGVLATSTTGLRFTHTGEVLEWGGVKWNNTYGGGSYFCMHVDPATGKLPTQAAHPECFVPHTQYIWMDAQRVLVH